MKPPLSLALLLSFCLSGCLATQRDVLDLSGQMDELSQGISSMQKNQADLALKMEELNSQIAILNETLKYSQDQTTQLSARLDDVSSALGQKVQNIAETIAKQQPSGSGATPGQVYHQAHLAYLKKRYDLATKGFSLYLEKFPKGEMADRALFYHAECYYAQENWAKAGELLSSFLDKHPQDELVPSARLKLALSLLKIQPKSQDARHLLLSITKDFPKSSEASAAKEYLKPK